MKKLDAGDRPITLDAETSDLVAELARERGETVGMVASDLIRQALAMPLPDDERSLRRQQKRASNALLALRAQGISIRVIAGAVRRLQRRHLMDYNTPLRLTMACELADGGAPQPELAEAWEALLEALGTRKELHQAIMAGALWDHVTAGHRGEAMARALYDVAVDYRPGSTVYAMLGEGELEDR